MSKTPKVTIFSPYDVNLEVKDFPVVLSINLHLHSFDSRGDITEYKFIFKNKKDLKKGTKQLRKLLKFTINKNE